MFAPLTNLVHSLFFYLPLVMVAVGFVNLFEPRSSNASEETATEISDEEEA